MHKTVQIVAPPIAIEVTEEMVMGLAIRIKEFRVMGRRHHQHFFLRGQRINSDYPAPEGHTKMPPDDMDSAEHWHPRFCRKHVLGCFCNIAEAKIID